MELSDMKKLDTYSQVSEGDLFYIHPAEPTESSLARVIDARENGFTYQYSQGKSGVVSGNNLQGTVLFRILASGELEILAGENVFNALLKISLDGKPKEREKHSS